MSKPRPTRSGLSVRDLMTREVITVKLEESVSRVQRLMQEKQVHCLPVIDDFDNVVGIVTSSDLLGSRPDEERSRVSNVMRRHVHALPQDADVTLLARVMAGKRIHHVVVLEHGKARGVVSSFDLLRLLADANLAALAQRARENALQNRPRPQAPPAAAAVAPLQPTAPAPTGPAPDSVSDPEFRDDPPPTPPPSHAFGLDAGFDLDPADEAELGLVFLDAAPDDKVADPLEFGEGV